MLRIWVSNQNNCDDITTMKRRKHCCYHIVSWFNAASMVTSSNGSIFRFTGHLCGEFTGPRWIPRTKASDAGLWCFLWSTSDKRLSKHSWGWWFETLSGPLWRQRNVNIRPTNILWAYRSYLTLSYTHDIWIKSHCVLSMRIQFS